MVAYGTISLISGQLRVQQGGDGEPVLLLVHGLGANGDVWSGLHDVLSARWPGRWVTPDLPGPRSQPHWLDAASPSGRSTPLWLPMPCRWG